ncbi:hypothetical protein WJX72_009848 [[Myrmecia] bisecta]|uniref:Disease resistance protein Roq1-like winged-helix domain-containing protein n=1 Tax=[Myrmecia] bisecta TaxID=41462 RepID=A0AAW1PEA8_9CHLO
MLMRIGPKVAAVQGISGWLHSPTEQSEADLVDRISVDVLNKLNPRARELPGIRVGVEAAVRDLVASAHLQQISAAVRPFRRESRSCSNNCCGTCVAWPSCRPMQKKAVPSSDIVWAALEPSGLAELVNSAVMACKGLPLTLKVMGALLPQTAKRAWSGPGRYPELGLRTLISRCLVTVDEDGDLAMHDQLRDMGRVIEERGRDMQQDLPITDRKRLWMLNNEQMHVLRKAGGALPNLTGLHATALLDLGGSEQHSLPDKLPASLQELDLVAWSEDNPSDAAHLHRCSNGKVIQPASMPMASSTCTAAQAGRYHAMPHQAACRRADQLAGPRVLDRAVDAQSAGVDVVYQVDAAEDGTHPAGDKAVLRNYFNLDASLARRARAAAGPCISGWLHSPTEQSEADLVDRISVDVLNKLNPRARELPSIRVGVEAAVRDLVASAHLQQDQQVRVLGLADEGIALLRHRLGGHKVLLVLDDVAQQSGPDIPDMVASLLVSESLPSGSRVIVTSRPAADFEGDGGPPPQ